MHMDHQVKNLFLFLCIIETSGNNNLIPICSKLLQLKGIEVNKTSKEKIEGNEKKYGNSRSNVLVVKPTFHIVVTVWELLTIY